MAELTAFGYFSGSTLLHLLDARFKLLFMIMLSLVVLYLHFLSLGIITGLLLGYLSYRLVYRRSIQVH